LEVPGETLLDLGLRYDWDNMRLTVNAHNVLDEEYVASAFVRGGDAFATIGPARTVTAGIGYFW
jgi:outer membrane receptor protein involved in Fe transport